MGLAGDEVLNPQPRGLEGEYLGEIVGEKIVHPNTSNSTTAHPLIQTGTGP
jgi:hypothetical protein